MAKLLSWAVAVFRSFEITTEDEQSAPWMTGGLAGLLVAVFIRDAVEFDLEWGSGFAVGTNLGGVCYPDTQWWELFNYIFHHRSLEHIGSNLLLFAVTGVYVERKYRWWRILPVFIMSGVGGGIAYALFVVLAEEHRCLVGGESGLESDLGSSSFLS